MVVVEAAAEIASLPSVNVDEVLETEGRRIQAWRVGVALDHDKGPGLVICDSFSECFLYSESICHEEFFSCQCAMTWWLMVEYILLKYI